MTSADLVRSTPADPNAPSLLYLPSEIRNAIYCLMFEMSNPVISSREEEDRYHARMQNARPILQKASRGVSKYVAIFLSCRQIYNEASSIFYANNSFTVKQICFAYETTATWLQSIGSRFHMLRHVVIDTYDGCNGWSDERPSVDAEADVEILPLLRLLWEHTDHKLVFSVVDPPEYWKKPGRRDRSVEILGALKRDELKLKKHVRYLQSVTMERWAATIKIEWTHSSLNSKFHVIDDGLQFFRPKDTNLLYQLPEENLLSIFRAISLSENRIVDVDLMKRTYSGAEFQFWAVHPRVDGLARNIFWCENTFRMVLRSSEISTLFAGYELFRKWFSGAAAAVGYESRVFLRLRVAQKHYTTLDRLRIGIMNLIWITSHAPHIKVWIRIELTCPAAESQRTTVCTSSLLNIRVLYARALLLLSEYASSRTFATGETRPELWMDGLGRVVSAADPVANTDFGLPISLYDIGSKDLNEEELVQFASRYAPKFPRSRYPTYHSHRRAFPQAFSSGGLEEHLELLRWNITNPRPY